MRFFAVRVPASKTHLGAKHARSEEAAPAQGRAPAPRNTTAQSMVETPAPPYSSGSIMPSQPSSAAFLMQLRLEGLLVFVPLGHLMRGNFGLDEIRRNFFNIFLVFG